jgi:dephospho-CoA kinase
MIIIGLTGSIGTGKSATAAMFAAHAIPVYDADAAVHALYAPGGEAVAPVEAAFPGVTTDGAIDRQKLSGHVLGDAEALKKLEAIVHPLVRAKEKGFLKTARAARAHAAILEIPLLFETGDAGRCDLIVVTSAPEDVQRQRVLEREGMTADKLDAILKKQMSDEAKRRRAHFVVETQHGFEAAEKQVADIVRAIAALPGRAD